MKDNRYQLDLNQTFETKKPFVTAFGFNAGTLLAELLFGLIRLAVTVGLSASLAYWWIVNYAPEFLERIAR